MKIHVCPHSPGLRNALTKLKRFIRLSIKKGSADMCQCGCRGWCTLFPLLLVLAIDLLACALGGYKFVHPEFRALANHEAYDVLSFVVAVIELRADWPAWCEVSGVRSWAHSLFPCPKCDLPLARMTTAAYIHSVSVESGPWNKYGQQNYDADVGRSTIEALIHFAIMLLCCYSISCCDP